MHIAADPTAHLAARGRHTEHPASCEVMCTAPVAAGTGGAGGDEEADPTPRRSKPPCEKPENRASGSRAKSAPSPLHATIEKLATPADPGADPTQAATRLEEQRLLLLEEAKEVSRIKLDIDMRMREYNMANGFKPITPRVAVAAKEKDKGKSWLRTLLE